VATRELNGPPNMLGLFARAGVGLVPGASRLPLVGGSRGQEVPDLTLELDDVELDRERVATYDKVCGFSLADAAPPTYLHILAFPLHLSLMTDPSFPFPAIGLVHIYNKITRHRPVRLSERVSLRVWATPIEPHPRGRQFSLRTEARVGDELVWEETATNLRRGSSDASEEADAPDVPSSEDLQATATWELKGDLGRRYGAVSGDLNPIHVHSLTARLFGFPSAIAHGMWTKARSLAALEPRLPVSFSVEAAFRKPILLPASVEFASGSGDGRIAFGVRDAAKRTPHLDGIVTSS
jgi:acyl dehydratase